MGPSRSIGYLLPVSESEVCPALRFPGASRVPPAWRRPRRSRRSGVICSRRPIRSSNRRQTGRSGPFRVFEPGVVVGEEWSRICELSISTLGSRVLGVVRPPRGGSSGPSRGRNARPPSSNRRSGRQGHRGRACGNREAARPQRRRPSHAGWPWENGCVESFNLAFETSSSTAGTRFRSRPGGAVFTRHHAMAFQADGCRREHHHGAKWSGTSTARDPPVGAVRSLFLVQRCAWLAVTGIVDPPCATNPEVPEPGLNCVPGKDPGTGATGGVFELDELCVAVGRRGRRERKS